jgi:hypothetical protein
MAAGSTQSTYLVYMCPTVLTDPYLVSIVVDIMAYTRRLFALGADHLHVRRIDRRLVLDDARLGL